MDQKTQFIAASLRDRLAMTERCELYGVSRKTGDNWVARSLTHGPQGLAERSRRPSTSPRHTPDHGVAALLDARRRPPSGGAKKLWSLLTQRPPRWPGPARSTVCDLRNRHGLVPKKRQRRLLGPPGTPTSHLGAPTEGWSADVKGPCNTGEGRYGSPLPSTDGSSRFLLRCPALSAPRGAEATPVFTRVFKDCGRPRRIRTDHGVPFATNTLARRSQLSAWWVRLGLVPECSEAGQPAQHGRPERRHRPLQAATTRPPGATLRAQQQQFNHCRDAFNHARPPEALDRRTPAACDAPPPGPRPTTLPPFADPDRFAGRDVSANGGIRWHHQGGNVSPLWVGTSVGLEDIADGGWNVSFGPLQLGRRLDRPRRIEEA